MYFFFCLLMWTLIGYFCARIAHNRGRNSNLWFFLGAVLGIIAVILLFILPTKAATAPSIQITQKNESSPPSYTPSEDVANDPPKPLWYYLDAEEKQYGPMSLLALKEAWDANEITPNTYLWNETMSDWQTLESLPETLQEIQT